MLAAILWALFGAISLLVNVALSGHPQLAIAFDVLMVGGSVVFSIYFVPFGQAFISIAHFIAGLISGILFMQPAYNDGKAEKEAIYYFTATHKVFLTLWIAGHVLVAAAIVLQ